MRIRTIKPEFWMHEGLAGCAEFSRLLAIALLNWADDEGYFMANPILIRGQVFPFVDDSKKVPRGLDELSRVGWIELAKDDQGRDVGRVINFLKHQRVDKPKPSTIKDSWRFQEESKNYLGSISDESKEEGNGREQGKGSGKGKEHEEVVDFWNSFENLPSIQSIGTSRMSAFKARMKEPYFRDNWRTAIEKIPSIPFLMGTNDRGWKADIDWLLKPESVGRIMEGKYSHEKKSTLTKTTLFDDSYERVSD